jgi:hypothetical protein
VLSSALGFVLFSTIQTTLNAIPLPPVLFVPPVKLLPSK